MIEKQGGRAKESVGRISSVNERMRMIADKRNDIRMFSEYQVSNVVSFLQFKRIRLL